MADKKDKKPKAPKTETTSGGAPAAEDAENLSLLDPIIVKGKMARDESQQTYAKDMVGEFVNQVLDEGMTISADTVASILDRIAQIDELLVNQLNEIMRDPQFQQLEASWRGLNDLVMSTETGTMLKLRLMNAIKKEVLNDQEKAKDSLRPEYDLDELEVVAYGSGWNRLRRLRRKGWKRALNPKRLTAIPNPLRSQTAVRKA